VLLIYFPAICGWATGKLISLKKVNGPLALPVNVVAFMWPFHQLTAGKVGFLPTMGFVAVAQSKM